MTEGVRAAKQTLRTVLRARLEAIDPARRAAWSDAACERVIASGAFQSAATLVGYLPMEDECDVRPVLREALAQGKRVAVPRVEWEDGSLTPCVVEDLEAGVVSGRHGVREPAPDAQPLALQEIGLLLIPGLGFDERCFRMGRGAGFYDRFLARLGEAQRPRAPALAAAFEAQVLAEPLPRDEWDEPLDAIATESRMIVREAGSVGR